MQKNPINLTSLKKKKPPGKGGEETRGGGQCHGDVENRMPSLQMSPNSVEKIISTASSTNFNLINYK